MYRPTLTHLFRLMLASLAIMSPVQQAARAQLAVFDPTNLIQNALSAARALEQVRNQVLQITNQIRQLENDARNLTNLGRTFAPELMSQLDQLDQLINAARGLALKVNETRTALETLYTGDYRNTDIASRARSAAQQMDNARSALQSSLLLQAQATEQLRNDQRILSALADASASATGALWRVIAPPATPAAAWPAGPAGTGSRWWPAAPTARRLHWRLHQRVRSRCAGHS